MKNVSSLSKAGCILLFLLTGMSNLGAQSHISLNDTGLYILEAGPGVTFEVDPRIELLSGVLLWVGRFGSAVSHAELPLYGRELKDFFKNWRQLPAFDFTGSMEDQGFGFDAPPTALLRTEGGLALTPIPEGFGSNLESRAQGSGNLRSFISHLHQLSVHSGFSKFFESRRSYYEGLLTKAASETRSGEIVAWLKKYFRTEGEYRFHFVLSPAYFPSGGFGPRVDRMEQGRMVHHVYQIIRDAEKISKGSLDGLSFHEFGHSFVNPAMGEKIPSEAINGITSLYKIVETQMQAAAYGIPSTFLNELFVRAATIRGMETLNPSLKTDPLFLAEERKGFFPIREAYALLLEYEKDREDFFTAGPGLVKKLALQASTLTEKELLRTAAAKRRAFETYETGFEGLSGTLGPEWLVEAGVSGMGKVSEIVVDSLIPSSEGACLTLRGDKDTQVWEVVSIPVDLNSGTLKANWSVQGQDLKKETDQYDNAFVGFTGQNSQGKPVFFVKKYNGSFPWQPGQMEIPVNPASFKRLAFTIFLSKSGTLSVDNIKISFSPEDS